jgi:hypothetical protein
MSTDDLRESIRTPEQRVFANQTPQNTDQLLSDYVSTLTIGLRHARHSRVVEPISQASLSLNPQVIHQDVPINANDDNGSVITEYIPAKYDFQAVKADYPPGLADPDLVPLTMIDETPYPYPEIVTRGVINYTLNVTQMGPGLIKIWDTPYKDHEYTVFGTPTTQNLVSWKPGFYHWPTFYLEGIEPSDVDDEITINLSITWDASFAPWTSTYRQVQGTVTPRIDTFKTYDGGHPSNFFGLVNGEPGPNSQTGYYAFTEFMGILIGALGSSTPKYVQNLMDGPDLLLNNTRYMLVNLPPPHTSRRHVFTPATEGFPLLDSDPNNKPYYGVPTGWNNEALPSGPDPVDPRKYDLWASDKPGNDALGNGHLWMQLKYRMEFKLWLVLSYQNMNGQNNMYPLAYITWTANLEADTFVNGVGLTRALGSVPPSSAYVKSHQKPDKTIPPLANDTWIGSW